MTQLMLPILYMEISQNLSGCEVDFLQNSAVKYVPNYAVCIY
jgi:hypothetical protein